MNMQEEILADARIYGTLRESQDPSGSAAGKGRGRSYPVNLGVRLCGHASHEGWEFWGEDGRLSCGYCHPPTTAAPRWASRGGPLTLVDLAVTPSGGTVVGVYAPTPELQNDERAPQRRGRRHEAQVGQGSVFG